MILEYYNQPWDFELLDSGNGFRLERWGEAVLMRPDPQAIWLPSLPETEWAKAWAVFKTGMDEEKGKWVIHRPMPQPWHLKFHNTLLALKLSPFKHTGVFAEQAAQWQWMLTRLSSYQVIKSKADNLNLKPKILNLFAYTGAATIALAKAGCFVTHVDASKPAISWANENAQINNLPQNSARWILDDAVKFVQREIKRGQAYDGIILDPPAFGHTPSGKTWKFARDVPSLLNDCVKLLSPQAKFLVLNAYATNSSALAVHHLLEDALKGTPGTLEYGELCLAQKNHPAAKTATSRLLSTGIFARWHSQ